VKQIFGKLGWQNDTSDLDATLSLADTDLEGTQAVPLSVFNQPEKAYTYPDSIKNKMVMATLKGSHFLTDDKLIAGNIYYRKNRTNGFNSNANSLLPADSSNISTNTNQDGFGGAFQLTLLNDLAGHKNQFTAGASVDFGRTDFTSDSLIASVIGHETVVDFPAISNGSVRLNAKNDYYGLYATDTFSVNDKLHVTLSGRYNIAKIKLSGFSVDDAGTTGDLNGNHHYSRFNPAIGVNYNPNNHIGFYGSYNEGMRAATPVELSCADENRPCALPNAFASDPVLQKVVAKTWEGGARGKFSENFNWNAGLYTTENNNDIQFIATNTTGFGFFKNVGQTRRRGIELGLNGKFDALSLSANYGFVDATYQSDFTASSISNSSADVAGIIQVKSGNRIPGIARHTLKIRAAYDLTPAWNIGSNVVLAASQYARGDENNLDVNGRVPGYAVVNLDTHFQINQNWKLFGKVNNVFDNEYATFGVLGDNIFNANQAEQFRSPSAPRAAWVGVSYEFGTNKKSATVVDDN
jgi:iron complex outermembrane recepter protein